jgi:hypothetical protein
MPVTKEFTVLIEDPPSTLGKVCHARANRNVNILGLHSFPIGGKSVTRFIAFRRKIWERRRVPCPNTNICAHPIARNSQPF